MYAWHWPTFRVWSGTWRQWRWVPAGMGPPSRDGIDWQQIEAFMNLTGIEQSARPAICDGLRTMQASALEAIAERS